MHNMGPHLTALQYQQIQNSRMAHANNLMRMQQQQSKKFSKPGENPYPQKSQPEGQPSQHKALMDQRMDKSVSGSQASAPQIHPDQIKNNIFLKMNV